MEKFIDIKQLSELLNVKVSTIYGWIHEDSIPYTKLMRLVRFKESEITEWLKKKSSRNHKSTVPLK